MDDTLSAGDPRTTDSFHQGWEKRILFSLTSPGKGKERRTGQGRVPRAPAAQAGRAELIHSQLHALWHGLPSVSGDHPPFSPPRPGRASQGGGLGAWPSRQLRSSPFLPPTGPVSPLSPRRLDSGPPLPRVPTQ